MGAAVSLPVRMAGAVLPGPLGARAVAFGEAVMDGVRANAGAVVTAGAAAAVWVVAQAAGGMQMVTGMGMQLMKLPQLLRNGGWKQAFEASEDFVGDIWHLLLERLVPRLELERVWVSDVGKRKATIHWRGKKPDRYGLSYWSDLMLEKKIRGKQVVRSKAVELSELRPGTRYYYVITVPRWWKGKTKTYEWVTNEEV